MIWCLDPQTLAYRTITLNVFWFFLNVCVGPIPSVSDAVGLGWRLRMFMPSMSPVDADAAGMWTTCWKPLP